MLLQAECDHNYTFLLEYLAMFSHDLPQPLETKVGKGGRRKIQYETMNVLSFPFVTLTVASIQHGIMALAGGWKETHK